MSVLVKGMKMPENCIECPLRKGTVCDAFQLIQPYTFKDDERAAFCPMTEVPEPKMGEWSEIENGEYLCSNCSHITIGYPPNYCPNCGSYNGGEE